MGKSQGMQLRWVKDGWFPTSQFTILTLYNTANLSHSQGN